MTRTRLICRSIALALLFLYTFPVSVRSEQAIQEDILLYSRPDSGVVLRSGFSEERLAYNQGPHVAPRLSPDKKRVLINSTEGGEPGVWIASRGGNRKERVCDGSQAAWSPDGTRIVFQREGRLVERTLASGEERFVSPEGAPALTYPSYVPATGSAAKDRGYRFICTDEAGRHVYLVAPNAQEPIELLVQGEIRSAPRCSPDGKTLAFQDGAHIYLVDFVTRNVCQLTSDPGVQASPVWSQDGQSICYARAPSPTAETWEICHVEVARPHIVDLIERKVHPGFDWSGSSPKPARTTQLSGNHLTVRQTLGTITIENDWLVLRLSRDGVRLATREKDARARPMTLRVMDADKHVADEVVNISVVEDSEYSAALRASFVAGGHRVLTSTIRVPRTRPFIEVAIEDGAGYVGLRADMEFAIVPDRLSNDLVLDSNQIASGATTVLPETSIVLGCLADSESMVVLAASSDNPTFAVTNSDDGSRLTAVMAAPGTTDVAIAVLAGGRMWQQATAEKDSARNNWCARWEKPFHAEWRLAVRGADAAYSRMWNVRDLGALGSEPLPIEETFDRPPEAAIIYGWGRDALTPADVLLPTDILADVWGVEGYLTKLDIEGVRSYRTSQDGTPFRELSLHQPGWHPALASEELTGEFGVLEAMGSVFPVANDGVRSLLQHLGNDALGLLQGLNDRVGEYERFLRDLATFCQDHQHEDRDGFLASVSVEAIELLKSDRNPPRTTITDVEKALQKVLAVVGTRDRLTLTMFEAFCRLPGNEEWAAILEEFMGYLAAKEGRLWHDDTVRFELWYDDDFEEFYRRCVTFAAQRQRVISQYRAWAKGICNRTAQLTIAHPKFKSTGDELRQEIHAILRNRYYLEGDWRGEVPLPGGALR